MNYTPPFRFDNGSIFKYSDEHNAYVFVGKKIIFKAQEVARFRRANTDFEKKYDDLKNEN